MALTDRRTVGRLAFVALIVAQGHPLKDKPKGGGEGKVKNVFNMQLDIYHTTNIIILNIGLFEINN